MSLRVSWPRLAVANRYRGLVAILILLFAAWYGALALRQHDALLTGVDLAEVDQAVWWTMNGHPLRITTRPALAGYLGFHVEPILLALVPLYAMAPSPRTLLLIQVFALALAAVPLYLLAVKALDRPAALAFLLLYLLSPAVHNATLSDFHAVTLGVLPAMAALLALWQGRMRAALLFAVMTLLVREDYGLWLAAVAIIGWRQTRNRVWIGVALAGLIWFLVATLAIIPLFTTGTRSLFWDRYLFWLKGPEAWQAQGLLPEKGRYLAMLLLMGGAGAWLAPLWALPALPALGLNLLSNFPLSISLDSHYSALVLPMLLAATAIGLRRFRPRLRGVMLLCLLATALWVHSREGRSPLAVGFRPPERTTHSRALPAVLAPLPADARLSASPALAPHVSERAWLRIAPNHKNCDYMVLDLLQDRSGHPLEMQQRVFDLMADGWGVRAGQHGFLLLEKGWPHTQIPATFYTFTRPEGDPQYAIQALFGGRWELVGYDLAWDYWSRPVVRLYWRILQPSDADRQPAALALDETGTILATPDTHPPVILLWFPTSRWQPGETYVVEMLPFDAPDRVVLVAGVGAPLADPATRLSTEDGQELLFLATLQRHGRGWRVQPARH